MKKFQLFSEKTGECLSDRVWDMWDDAYAEKWEKFTPEEVVELDIYVEEVDVPGLSMDTRPAWREVDTAFGVLIREAANVMVSPAADYVAASVLAAAHLQQKLDTFIESFGLSPAEVTACSKNFDTAKQREAVMALVKK